MILQLSHISKLYKNGDATVQAVDDVSLTIDEGEFVAVRGPSGCGKSTLLLIAGGLLSPTGGTVQVANVSPYQISPNQRAMFRAENVGFVFQQFHLIPYLSVMNNILAPTLAISGESKLEKTKQAENLLQQFGLEERQHHLPSQLSIGERQRTALARALLNNPKLLLADEPTGNLDSENAEIVLKHLQEFASNGGAVLLVTHDDRAVSFAQRTIYLRNGKMEESHSS
ncbi:Lipoprotein releasing system ATP-binding protein LolD [hydrothermal vent metagenome]|uniref:Lipoprotein releasing system ATP-binding protein LolD n=1 Tax=hydrothermal vent metagenome TaxID=652676 RepID=A0A3B1D3W9_9ZZZZ